MLQWWKDRAACQRIKKDELVQAPLIPLRVIKTPHEVIVIDIEGPFPRSRDVYRLVLTGMCFNSRFPEVVLAETVVEAMVDIFSRTGVPKQILTRLAV